MLYMDQDWITEASRNGKGRWKTAVSAEESERMQLIPHHRLLIDRGIVPDLDEFMHRPSPVIAYFDGSAYHIAEGVFRYRAYVATGQRDILCDVRPGGFLDALRYSAGNRLSLIVADLLKAVALIDGYQGTRRWKDDRVGKVLRVEPAEVVVIRLMIRNWSKRRTDGGRYGRVRKE